MGVACVVRRHAARYPRPPMATDINIKLPADLLAQAQRLAQAEGKTVDQLAAEAVRREVALKLIAQHKREIRPSGMTEDQEMETVMDAVHDYRRGR